MKARNVTTQHSSSREDRETMGKVLEYISEELSNPNSKIYKEEN